MKNQLQRNFKNPLRRLLGRYYNLAGVIIFFIGIFLRLASIGKIGFFWEATKDFGTFLAVAVFIPFIYERLIKAEERQLFLSDIEEILDKKLLNQILDFKLYPYGRPSVSEKTDLIRTAKEEVIYLGIAHRTFTSYFEQRPSREYKEPFFNLLETGITIKCIAIDPDSDAAQKYANDRGETELINNVKLSIKILKKLADEFNQNNPKGKFEIYLSSHLPCFSATCVDGNTVNGRLLISPYLYGIKRAEMPHFEFSRFDHEVMFEKYWLSIQKILADSHQL